MKVDLLKQGLLALLLYFILPCFKIKLLRNKEATLAAAGLKLL
jgi:hypothetical protein